jgi:hypothetical protein
MAGANPLGQSVSAWSRQAESTREPLAARGEKKGPPASRRPKQQGGITTSGRTSA